MKRLFQKLVFAAKVDNSTLCPNYKTAYGHGCEYFVGNPGENFPVFESSGFSFIGIADHIFLFTGSFGGKFPLQSRRKTGATPAFQFRTDQFVDQLLFWPVDRFLQNFLPISVMHEDEVDPF
jgi:hypothetical protein